MTTTNTVAPTAQPTIPLDRIHMHPSNPRRRAVADDDMVASVRSVGIITAVTVAPHPDIDGDYTLIGGHRRHNAAAQAGLTEVPAMLRDDLVTEAQQLEAMLVENLHREGLTVMEEADAYEQLTLFFGMDAKAIAKATGRAVTTVKSRLKLTSLSDTASDRLHAGDITIADAEALLEFADDPETLAELEEHLGTANFAWRLQHALDGHKRRVRNSNTAARLAGDLGAVQSDGSGTRRLDTFSADDLREPAGHPECLGYIDHGPDSYSEPFLVCLEPEIHADVEQGAQQTRSKDSAAEYEARQAEFERQREERAAAQAASRAAGKVRVAWLAGHYRSLLPAKGKPAEHLGAALRAVLPAVLADSYIDDSVIDSDTFLAAAGIDVDPNGGYQATATAVEEYATKLQAASTAKALDAFAVFLATMTEAQLDSHIDDDGNPDALQRNLALWDWITAAGYQMADPDNAIRARTEHALAGPDDGEGGDDK